MEGGMMKRVCHFSLAMIIFLTGLIITSLAQEAVDIIGKASSGVVTVKAWDSNKSLVGEGTGFAIDESLVVLPYHLISQAAEAEITTISGKTGKIETLVGYDRNYNIALVRVKGKLNPVSLGTSQKLEPGARLFALTEIAGQVIITEGSLRNWLEIHPGRVRVIDLSMSLEKPACGAPIFDNQAKVVGMAMVLSSGVKFGVPLEAVLAFNRQARGAELKTLVKENFLDSFEGSYLAGKTSSLLNEPGMATIYLEKYIKLKPDDLESYILLGKAYYRLGNNSEAYKNFARAALLNPSHPDALYGLGLCHLKERRFKEAAEFLEKAIANGVNSREIFFELATAYEEIQDYHRAADNYEKYVKSGPDNPWSGWLKLALTSIRINQPERAIAAYREALKINPDDVSSNYNLGKLLAENGQYEEAEMVFLKLVQINKRDAITYYGQIMQMYDKAGNYNKAVEAARKIVELSPNNEVALYNLGIMLDRAGKLEEAASVLNECLRIKPDYNYAWFNLGLIYDKMRKHAESVEAFKKYTALAPDDASGWLNLGLEYMLMKDFESALPHLEKSVKLNPNNAVAQYNLGITYINLKDNYSAREVLKVLQRLDPTLAGRLSKLIK